MVPGISEYADAVRGSWGREARRRDRSDVVSKSPKRPELGVALSNSGKANSRGWSA